MRHERRKIERVLNMNYIKSRLTEGDEWYLGNGEFLTLRQTKKHLLEKMDCIKAVLKTAHQFCTDFNDLINEAEISIMRQLSEDFFEAFQAFERQEFNMRQRYWKEADDEELPF